MGLAYKVGRASGILLCKVGLQAAIVAVFEALEGLLVVTRFLAKITFGIAFTAGLLFGVYSLYQHFSEDFARPVSINSIAEAVILVVAFFAGTGIISFVWRLLFANEHRP